EEVEDAAAHSLADVLRRLGRFLDCRGVDLWLYLVLLAERLDGFFSRLRRLELRRELRSPGPPRADRLPDLALERVDRDHHLLRPVGGCAEQLGRLVLRLLLYLERTLEGPVLDLVASRFGHLDDLVELLLDGGAQLIGGAAE